MKVTIIDSSIDAVHIHITFSIMDENRSLKCSFSFSHENELGPNFTKDDIISYLETYLKRTIKFQSSLESKKEDIVKSLIGEEIEY